MIAPDRKHSEATQQVEIADPLAIEQILAAAATEADVVADRSQHAHHLLVQVGSMHRVAVAFARGEQSGDVLARCRYQRIVAAEGFPRESLGAEARARQVLDGF